MACLRSIYVLMRKIHKENHDYHIQSILDLYRSMLNFDYHIRVRVQLLHLIDQEK